MAYDADPSATHNPSTGGTPTAAWGDILNANFAYLGAAWTSFTPAMTFSGGGSLTIGDGTIVGAYRQVGKTLHLRIVLTVGSTTTFGTGDWRFTLPNSLTSIAAIQRMFASVRDDSAGTETNAAATAAASATYMTVRQSAGTSNVSSTVPFTWATSDVLTIGPCELEVA